MFGMTSPFFWNWKGLEKHDAKGSRRRGYQNSLNNFDIKEADSLFIGSQHGKIDVQETVGITG